MKKKEALWTRDYILLLLLAILNVMGFSMTSSLISKYSMLQGATLSLSGIVAGLFSVTAMCLRPFSGFLADKINQKRLLLFSLLGTSAALAGYSFTSSIAVLCFFRIIHGACYAISGTVTHTVAARLIPKSRIGEGIGYFSFGNVIATAIAPRLGLWLGETAGYVWSFRASAVCTLAGASLTFFIMFSSAAPGFNKRKKPAFSDFLAVSAVPLALVSGLFSMTNGVISSFLVPLGEERLIIGISGYFTVKAISLMISRFLVSRIADKTKLSFIYYPAAVFEIIAMILLARANVYAAIAASAVCKAFGQGIGQPAIQAEIVRRADPAAIGVATSTFYLASDAGQGLGPILGGFVSEHFGYEAMFYFFGLVMLAGMIFYLLYAGRFGKKPVQG